jgi:hypothetical protein
VWDWVLLLRGTGWIFIFRVNSDHMRFVVDMGLWRGFPQVLRSRDLRSSGMLRSGRLVVTDVSRHPIPSWRDIQCMTGCSETLVINYYFILRNIAEEQTSYLHCGGSVKSRMFLDSFIMCRPGDKCMITFDRDQRFGLVVIVQFRFFQTSLGNRV